MTDHPRPADPLAAAIAEELEDLDRPRYGGTWRLWVNPETVAGRFTTTEVSRAIAARLRDLELAAPTTEEPPA